MTAEEKKENSRLRTQKCRNKLKEKIGEDEYRKQHALKMAKQREKKKIMNTFS